MKVAMIGWEYPPQFSGGLGIHCEAIVNELTKLGINIDFYLPSFQTTEFHIPDGMTLYQVKMNHELPSSYNGSTTLEAVHQFRAELQKVFKPEGVDIIHAQDWMGAYSVSELAKSYKIPLVWTVHSTEFNRAAGNPMHPGIFNIEKDALSHASQTITVSNHMKNTLSKIYAYDSNQIKVVYNGIDLGPFEQMSNRNYQDLTGNILFLGRVTGQKAPDCFLEAAREVLKGRDVNFMIAGDGDMLGVLRHRARRWKIDHRVQFTGAVTGEKLLDCYRDAIIFVLPAISEPFGITVLEALAAGLPTIISTSTGAGEIVQNVQLVDPKNSSQLAQTIITLLDNPHLRQKLGQAGKREAKQWSWQRAAIETHDIYLNLLRRGD